nr:vitamin K epoxide reductase family protein [uncultured Macellibacteroides sp.]
MDNILYNISCRYLKLSAIFVDNKELKVKLYSHEYYPSLVSLTDVLTDMGIQNMAVKTNINNLKEIEKPVLLHLGGNVSRFIIVTRIADNKIEYYKSNSKKEKKLTDDVLKDWDGVLLYIAKPKIKNQLEEILEKIKQNQFMLIFVALLALFIPFVIKNDIGILYYLLLAVKLIGLCFTFFLLRHDLDINSKFERHLCSLSKNISCDAVLNSSASKFLGLFKMSSISLVYFVFGIILLLGALVTGTYLNVINLLLFISLFSIPYIIYSLSYQMFVIKKWCLLCLSVIFSLVLENLISAYLLYTGQLKLPSYIDVYIAFFVIIILILAWSYLYSKIKQIIKAEEYEIQYFKLKKNYQIFRLILDNQPLKEIEFSSNDIILGDIKSRINITIAINVTCSPCLQVYTKLKQLLNEHPDRFSLNIRFLSKHENVDKNLVELFLISLYYLDNNLFIQAFDKWNLEKDYSNLYSSFKMKGDSEKAHSELLRHRKWGNKLKISNTPIIFINGKELPVIYTKEDLEYFLITQ